MRKQLIAFALVLSAAPLAHADTVTRAADFNAMQRPQIEKSLAPEYDAIIMDDIDVSDLDTGHAVKVIAEKVAVAASPEGVEPSDKVKVLEDRAEIVKVIQERTAIAATGIDLRPAEITNDEDLFHPARLPVVIREKVAPAYEVGTRPPEVDYSTPPQLDETNAPAQGCSVTGAGQRSLNFSSSLLFFALVGAAGVMLRRRPE